MGLVIENVSSNLLEINDLGFGLEASSSVDIMSESDANAIAASASGGDLDALITSGFVVVKDPIGGANLSVADGLAAIRSASLVHFRTPPGGRINDSIDVDVSTSPTDGQVLAWDSATQTWIPSEAAEGVDTALGGTSKRMNTWTLLSGTLYYNDFEHNLGTTEIAVHLREFSDNHQIQAEYTEIIDADKLRVVVDGNTEDIVVNVVSGAGPEGPEGPKGDSGTSEVVDDTTPTLGGDLSLGGYSIDNITATEFGYLDGITSNIQTQIDGKTTPTGHTHTFKIPHTWGISGSINVASGQTNYLLPMFISLAPGQTASLVSCRHRINGGTSATITLQNNGVDVAGFDNMLITQTATTTNPSDVVLSENDMLQAVVTTTVGAPQNLSLTVFVEYSQ